MTGTIAFIGAGNMGGAIAEAVCRGTAPEQVVIEIDADDFSIALGQQNIACHLYVPSNGKIFALGSYVVQCKIEIN